MIRKMVAATVVYLGRRVIKQAATSVLKRVIFKRGKPDGKIPAGQK